MASLSNSSDALVESARNQDEDFNKDHDDSLDLNPCSYILYYSVLFSA